MADIVNLSRARKARANLKKRTQADANAVKFGRPKAERAQDEQAAEQARRALDAHRRDPE